ncbi:MAG: flagellar basal body P-ring protein FlgI [Planctomycetota bacterium]
MIISGLICSLLLQAPAVEDEKSDDFSYSQVRVGDVAQVKGMRTNALWGTGLIVGLNGTGDTAKATRQALANLLEKYNLNIAVGDLQDGNAALVSVTSTLPPFGREGDRVDVVVSATGGAKSLFGGTLLFTPLSAVDGVVYAVAQGPVTVGGFAASGTASSVSQNHPTVGVITAGASLEEDVPSRFVSDDRIVEFRLDRPDFESARRIAEALNAYQSDIARTLNPSMVQVSIPDNVGRDRWVGYVADLSELRFYPHQKALVIVNEKTGTIVAGQEVRISRVAIVHGNLTVTVAESPQVSQPLPESYGVTTIVPRTDLNTSVESGNEVLILPTTASIAELASALNALGATPRDLISILQMLKESGSLHAELEVH